MSKFHLALVTGATSGIGEQMAHLLACEGIELIVVGRDSNKLAHLTNELSPMVSVEAIQCDLAADRAELLSRIRDRKPDLVVNCAGIAFYGNTLNHPTVDLLELIETNNRALVELTIESAHTLVEAKRPGTILNVSSILGSMVAPGAAVYAASKAFVDSFSQGLDIELAPYGIRVLAACPGTVATNFIQRATRGRTDHYPGVAMQPTACAKLIWRQIVRGHRLERMDGRFRWLWRLSRLLPKSILHRRLYAIFSER